MDHKKEIQETRRWDDNKDATYSCDPRKTLRNNPKSIEDYKAGKKKAQGFLVGQCIKALKGKGDPKMVTQLLNSKLQGL